MTARLLRPSTSPASRKKTPPPPTLHQLIRGRLKKKGSLRSLPSPGGLQRREISPHQANQRTSESINICITITGSRLSALSTGLGVVCARANRLEGAESERGERGETSQSLVVVGEQASAPRTAFVSVQLL